MLIGAPEDILLSSRSTPVTKRICRSSRLYCGMKLFHKHPVKQIIPAPRPHHILVLCSCFNRQAQEAIQEKAPKEIQCPGIPRHVPVFWGGESLRSS